jgi:hypothetical protein
MVDERQSSGPTRIEPGEVISALSAVALLVVMFFTAWYGVDQLPSRLLAGAGRASAENAWHGLTIVRWVMLVTIIVAVGSVALHASQSAHGTKTDTGAAITALGLLTAALLFYRVLIALPAPDRVVDQKLGALLGLLSAMGIAVGGYESMREERGPRVGSKRSRDRLASGGAAR